MSTKKPFCRYKNRHHCSHTAPMTFYFRILDISLRNSGVILRVWNGAIKAPIKIACMSRYTNLNQNSTRPPIVPIYFLYWSVFNLATLRAKSRLELEAGMELYFFIFSPVSLVWVPPTRRHSQYPCPKFDIAALLNNIYSAYIWSRGRSGQL